MACRSLLQNQPRSIRRLLARYESTIRQRPDDIAYAGLDIEQSPRQLQRSLRRNVLRSVVFATTLSVTALALVAERTNDDVRQREVDVRERLGQSIRNRLNLALSPSWANTWPTSDDLAAERRYSVYKRVSNWVNATSSRANESWRRANILLAESWINRSEAQRTCLALIGVQSVIFMAWQIPRTQPIMIRHFLSHPLSSRVHTHITSVFSHQSLAHFAFNSIALYSIGTSAHSYFFYREKETLDLKTSTSRYEFLAFFVAAGIASSLTSQAYTVFRKLPMLVRQGVVAADTARASLLPSLGASGAIWACLSVSALAWPDASVSLIILPFIPFPIGYGVLGMATLDIIGLVRGWKLFDHAAHLGGATFGLLYYYGKGRLFDGMRRLLGGSAQSAPDL